jgi:hypothetical protein
MTLQVILIHVLMGVFSHFRIDCSELIVAHILVVFDSLNVLLAWIKWNYSECDSVSLGVITVNEESGEDV